MATATSTRTPGFNVTNNAEVRTKLARIAELKQIEREAAAAERERKALEAEVRAEMGDHTQIVLRGNVIAKLSSVRTTNLYDYKLLQEGFPEAYAAVHSIREYQFLSVL